MAINSYKPVDVEAWHREIQELSAEWGTFPLLYLLGYICRDLTDEQRGAAVAGAWQTVRESVAFKAIDTPGAGVSPQAQP